MSFIPHNAMETQEMLQAIGVADLNALFEEIPTALQIQGLKLPEPLSEMAATQYFENKAQALKCYKSFCGAGAYDHFIPAAVWKIAERGEWMTAYTPYQAEASQGTLQLLYEFQTMMARLMGMEVSNASMYDGATALAEAVLMALRIQERASVKKRILVPESVHPHYREVLKTFLTLHDVAEYVEIPIDLQTGTTDLVHLKTYAQDDFAALIIPTPNFFGALEPVHLLTNFAHERGALVIAVANPLVMSVVTPPGEFGHKGADIVCGDGQPLGLPLHFGGPYFGFLTTRKAFIRQLPGRIVARTRDRKDRDGFVLTLQAREQHIRRAKATSNICTNQGLLVTAATIYMAMLGNHGLKEVALQSHLNLNQLKDKLKIIKGVQFPFQAPSFHEAVFITPKESSTVLEALYQKEICGGVQLTHYYPQYAELSCAILCCTTEKHTEDEIETYAKTVGGVVDKVAKQQGVLC